jgi:preprotein translocase subunit SecG
MSISKRTSKIIADVFFLTTLVLFVCSVPGIGDTQDPYEYVISNCFFLSVIPFIYSIAHLSIIKAGWIKITFVPVLLAGTTVLSFVGGVIVYQNVFRYEGYFSQYFVKFLPYTVTTVVTTFFAIFLIHVIINAHYKAVEECEKYMNEP